MARAPITDSESSALLGVERKRKKLGGTGKAKREQLLSDVRDRMRSKSERKWDRASPAHLVAVYYLCHERVYGVVPAELDQDKSWKLATVAAAQLVRNEFGGSFAAALDYVQWVWMREDRRAGTRAKTEWRVTWRQVFGRRSLLTDWRVVRARDEAML